MRIYFVGIGGAGIGPLALMAYEAGYEVAGSDAKDSSYIHYLKNKGLDISLDQSGDNIKNEHLKKPIDWVVGVSSIVRDNPYHPELKFAQTIGISIHERDALLNKIIRDKNLELIAVAGTHGKTTTTAMLIWILNNLNVPISYSVGAKLPFADMSAYNQDSKYFIYECDEFHKNFLNFYPKISAITGIAWDHHEVFETENIYNESFVEFLNQSEGCVIYEDDASRIGWKNQDKTRYISKEEPSIDRMSLKGVHFRQDAWLAINTINKYFNADIDNLIDIINKYPGSSRRMEKLAENLYSDYAHTPEKIEGCLSTATEMLSPIQKLVVVYEPLTNRRQHYIKDRYKNIFSKVDILYWVPSYLAREDSSMAILEPSELISQMDNSHIATPVNLDDDLKNKIVYHLKDGDFVVLISGGGGGSLDDWARINLKT